MINLFQQDLGATLGRLGRDNVDEPRSAKLRHPRAYGVKDFRGWG